MNWFLCLWFLGEIAAYFVLSPFTAVRRFLGIAVVWTLVVGRLAARDVPASDPFVRVALALSLTLALLYHAVDWRDADAERRAVVAAYQHIRQRDTEGKIWFIGHWGFQFYAERAGMVPVIPGKSVLKPGDWLINPSVPIDKQSVHVDTAYLENEGKCVIQDGIPLATVPYYYRWEMPLRHHQGARVSVDVYRVRIEYEPR